MKTSVKVIGLISLCVLIIMASVAIGSIYIPMTDLVQVLSHQIFRTELPATIPGTMVNILWGIRFPRVLMAFVSGAALAISGTVMQSILRNPLASSYTLGVSAGASLGAAIVIVLGLNIPFLGVFGLPIVGFASGLITVFLVMTFTARMDKNLSNQTIILVGMVFSLFVNGLLTMVTALSRTHLEQLIFWQLGSFSGASWVNVGVLLAITLSGILILMSHSREMDMMSFGEEQALSVGINLKRVKFLLIAVSALLTGSTVAFVGIIGFVDLIAPHIIRKLFGTSHVMVLPMSALFGGVFMVLGDLLGRTLLAPSEIPIGAITALIGAPFFAVIYFYRRK